MSAIDKLLSLFHQVTVEDLRRAREESMHLRANLVMANHLADTFKAANEKTAMQRDRLRAALNDMALYEMQFSQIENGYEVGGSDGWECALCFDEPGDERPSFETAADVTHRPCCVLYEELPSQHKGPDTLEKKT